MRQGNGSDLLGANDPRSATIGVIYVAPNDDRESVLAAILTQEKLGRKQIAIVLPPQNKAFQRPIDFEGLKNMRRKLQAQLIIVAPQGSGPAEFARQRRFTFFSSLESYGRSLREEGEASRSVKRGLFGVRRTPRPAPDANANDDAMAAPSPQNVADEEQPPFDDQHAMPNNIIPLAGVGAAGFAAGQAMGHDSDVEDLDAQEQFQPIQPGQYIDEDEDSATFLPPPPSPPQPFNNQPPDYDDEQVEMVPPPPQPLHVVNADDDEVEDHITGVDDNNQIEDHIPGVNDEEEELPPAAPVPLVAPFAPVPDEEDEEYEDQDAVSPLPWRQSSGKRNVVGVPYAAAGAGTVGGGVSGAVVTPTPGTAGGGTGSGSRRRRRGLLWIPLIALLMLSVLICGGIALAAPGTFSSTLGSIQKFSSNVVSGGTPTATVTIEPKSALLSNTYVVTGITSGIPDSSKRQVQARQLTFTTQPQSKTVPATDQKQIPATRATGTITFYNSSTSAYYVAANTVFTDARGVQIANDSLVGIPGGNPASGTYGNVTVPAHAVNAGSSGNVRAGDITNLPCCGNAAVGVSTTGAFSGGQDPQNYTAVQQSDVDNAANPLKAPLLQSALTTLNGQKKANEQYIHTPQCSTNVTSNPAVGARATSVTVSVTAICKGEVYDQVGAQTIGANLLKAEADKSTGGNYALAGNLVTSITSVTGSGSNLSILVKAEGVWVYQFDATAKINLAKLIAGKAQNDATGLLLQQAGVSKVDSITGENTLPTDYKQITIVVQSVVGIQGTPTTTPGASPTTEPTAKPPTVTPTTAGS